MQRHGFKRFLALVLALVMGLSTITVTPSAFDESLGTFSADTTSPPALYVPDEATSPPALEVEEEEEEEEEELIEGFFLGTPLAPAFSHQGGVHQSAFNLSVNGHGAEVRYTTDGSVPRVCTGFPQTHLSPCICSPVLEPNATIPINYRAATVANSPMSIHGVGRANPGPWNAPWASGTGSADETSAFTSPHNPTFTATHRPSAALGGGAYPDGNGGYYAPGLIYNGMVVRARAFDINGLGGPTSTSTFIVNRPDMDWDGVRIVALTTDPVMFRCPIRGWYRNWDRGMDRFGTPGREWVDNNYYNWEAQIRAGMWDGRDWEGNPAPVIAPNMPTHPGNNNGQGWGLPVVRRSNGRAENALDQDGSRQPVNVEMYGENNVPIINQGAMGWSFGNWSRLFPLRSIRLNFNQGDGDVRNTPELIPNTRKHFYAADELVGNFRHINLRVADLDGSDLKDPLVQALSHPLRPTVQNNTWSAVFINGEFWGMYNTHTHRHEALISEVFGLPRNDIEMADQAVWMSEALSHIAYPISGSAFDASERLGVRTDIAGATEIPATASANLAAGAGRRTALGAGSRTGNTLADHQGYARRVPEIHPRTEEPLASAGATHLTREWYDYLDTIFDMDDLIDMFIIGIHFENWDWVSNNFEGWRSTVVHPGVYGADGRWRFIVQDFDNAVFDGRNDMFSYFTAMTSPACLGSGCSKCRNRPSGSSACATGMEAMDYAGLPWDIFEMRRHENAARILRVLFQNPTFRETFAARYSTYAGTAFHPARVTSIVESYVERGALGGSSPVIGRHLRRWGLQAKPKLVPWNSGNNASETDRMNAWLTGNPNGWAPESLRGTPGSTTGDRGQEQTLRLRASSDGTTSSRDTISHMRRYFMRTPGNGSISGTGAIGRENLGLTVPGDNMINWRITTGNSGTSATSNDIGWLDIAGANIRNDLYKWGNQAFYADSANTPATGGFMPFSIGNFGARYIRNMPIEVTINDNPGYTFQNWLISGPATITTGSSTTRSITITPNAMGAITVTACYSPAPATAIINQVYGNGTQGDNAISHGFIELYNPWDTAVNLNGTSLQIQNIGDNTPANLIATDWFVEPLSGSIPPKHSYLIVSDKWPNTGGGSHTPSYIIQEWDREISVELSNRNISVALVSGSAALSPVITPSEQNRIQDLVGARNSNPPRDQVHNVWGPQAAWRISRNSAARRINFKNTRDNYADFEEISYNSIPYAEIEHYRPRSLKDLAWPDASVTLHTITIDGGISGYRAFPNPAAAGQLVSLQAGTNPVGQAFYNWSSDDVTILGANLNSGAIFIMPDKPVTATVNFIPVESIVREPSVMINQVHGQGPVGGNAISHGFIELYNPTDHSVNIGGWSVHLMNQGNGAVNPDAWNKINLPNHTMESGSSFLIVSQGDNAWSRTTVVSGHRPRYIIPTSDLQWDIEFSNRSMTVALVSDQVTELSHSITPTEMDSVIDLVGTVNSTGSSGDPISNYWGSAPADRISRQVAARRRNFQNTGDNKADFREVDYRYPSNYPDREEFVDTNGSGISNPVLQQVKPRSAADGPWGIIAGEPGDVLIRGGGRIGAGASPNPATGGQTVTITAGYNDGFVFDQWTVMGGGVTLANANERITTFVMPNPPVPVTIRANWFEFYNVTVKESRASVTGAGTYSADERVVINAGSRLDGHLFEKWTGADVHLLADRYSSITYFDMPNRNVDLTATWEKVPGAESPFPLTLRAHTHPSYPSLVRALWKGGHVTSRDMGESWNGDYVAINSGVTRTVTGPGNFTLVLAGAGTFNWPDPSEAFRAVLVVVAADGSVTTTDTFSNANHQATRTGGHGRVSTLPPSKDVYISYNPGAPQTVTAPETGIPPGHFPQTLVDLYDVIVVGSQAPTGQTGAGRFPEDHRIAINAGQMAGQVFTGWTASPAGSVIFADRTDPITSFIMPDHDVTVTASFGDMMGLLPAPSIVINQVYGQGTGVNAINRGFIELYNPTNNDVELDGWSLQVWNSAVGIWNVIPLPYVTVEPRTSFLVATENTTAGARYNIENYDLATNVSLSGRSLSVALVSQTSALDSVLSISEWRNVHDMVGVQFETQAVTHLLGTNPALRTSNQFASRRVNFQNTRTNSSDFEAINYSTGGISNDRLNIVRPRFSGDGDWAADLVEAGQTVVQGGGAGSGASPATGAAGNAVVTINAGTNPGFAFSHWTVLTGGVTLANANAATTTFTMPATPVAVTVQAHWNRINDVTIENAQPGNVGTGAQNVGQRVVVFAGNHSAVGMFFDGWTGADAALLQADPKAPINYFIMPDRPVNLTANWVGLFSPPFPMTLRGITNTNTAPTSQGNGGTIQSGIMTFGRWIPDVHHLTDQQTQNLSSLPQDLVVNGAGIHTLILHTRNAQLQGGSESRLIHVTVTAEGTVTAVANGACPWYQFVTTPYARVSHRASAPGVTFISYGSAVPAGDTAGSAANSVDTFQLTVNGTNAATPSGAGLFAGGRIASINAGTPPAGQRFNGWTVNSGGVTLANSSEMITTFTMPANAVTVTANWTADTRQNPVVTWPSGLTAKFGQTLSSVTLPANTGGTPGTFSWVEEGTTPVGNIGQRRHALKFTPSNLTNFFEATNDVFIEVSGADAPTLTFPTASDIMLGQTLADSTFSGAVSAPAVGTWTWVNPATQPTSVGTHTYAVAFTPSGSHITSFNWTPVPGFGAGPPLTIVRNVSITVVNPPQRPAIRGDVIINQVYGHGATPNDNAVSHGFIELYNTTNAPISLNGYSLQAQIIATGTGANTIPTTWQVLNLNGRTIPANRSLLIVSSGTDVNNSSQVGHTPRYTIPTWDIAWNLTFSNANMSVALVQGTDPLEIMIGEIEEFGRVVDLVGTQSRPFPADISHNYYEQPARGSSQYIASRRNNLANTWNNQSDFRTVDYRFPVGYAGNALSGATSSNGITNEQLQQFRPRHSGEPNFASMTRQTVTASVTGQPEAEVTITPTGERVATTTMTITVAAPAGKRFTAAAGTAIPATGAAGAFSLYVTPSRYTATGVFAMPATSGAITITAAFEDVVIPPGVVINQMYGRSFAAGTSAAVSRGFIEIYNPLSTPYDLAGHSLQVQNLADGNGVTNTAYPWQVLDFSAKLSNTILPARTSLLIVTNNSSTTGTSYNIPNWDTEMDMEFSNRNFSAAIVTNTTQLSTTITPAQMENIVDLVGALNNNDGTRDRVENYWGVSPASGLSNQQSVRRDWEFGGTYYVPVNSRNNSADFLAERYQDITNTRRDMVRPRHRAEGAWSYTPLEEYSINVIGTAAAQTTLSPSNVMQSGEQVTVTVTAPLGQRLSGAAGSTIAVTGLAAPFNLTVSANRLSATGTFTMPPANSTITVNATFANITLPEGLVINQVYGRTATATAPAANRSFIELYNSTSATINLSGLSLQLQPISDSASQNHNVNQWNVHTFTSVSIPAHTSYLVVSASQTTPNTRYTVSSFDVQSTTLFTGVNDRNFSVAIVQGTTPLSTKITEGEMSLVVDLVGAWQNSNGTRDRVDNFLGTAPANGISNQHSVRRNWSWHSPSSTYILNNSKNNVTDFSAVNYAATGGIDASWLTVMRPRSIADGAWVYAPPGFTVTFDLNGGNIGGNENDVQVNVASGAAAPAPENVTRSGGYVFNGWDIPLTGISANVTATAQWLRLGAVSSNGDINGSVTSLDVVWLARHVAGHAGFNLTNPLVGDINMDGVVDAADITALLRWLVGYRLEDLAVGD
ncbi:MAG: lamin tail domain-containing protein [Defluviitaleaceae bacterium]|nr:lamin tail domain-containing protein [Defluviitaleaceae bacterium]